MKSTRLLTELRSNAPALLRRRLQLLRVGLRLRLHASRLDLQHRLDRQDLQDLQLPLDLEDLMALTFPPTSLGQSPHR